MGLLEKDKGRRVHNRTISTTTYECGDDEVIVEGELMDRRLIDGYRLTGKPVEPGIIHNLIIRMRIKGASRTITEIEVEMPTVPREECHQTRSSLSWLKGKTITEGFTAMVKQKTGKGQGCQHLSSLVLTMAPAILQGTFVQGSRDPIPKALVTLLLEHFLTDTCHVWRKDGELIKEIREEISKKT